MSGQILTVVTATVDAQREADLVAGYRQLTAGPTPDGLIRTELLRGQDGKWQIQTLWRDREALMAMRAGAEPPASLRLFGDVGAEHSHEFFVVEHAHRVRAAES